MQVRSDYAEKYPEVVVAYLKATLEADRLYREDPEGLSERLAKWTGVDAEVYYAFHGPQGIQTRDYSLKPEHVKAIAKAHEVLKVLKKVTKEIDVAATSATSLRRPRANLATTTTRASKTIRHNLYRPPGHQRADQGAQLAGQIWARTKPRCGYSTPEATFRGARTARTAGKAARVTSSTIARPATALRRQSLVRRARRPVRVPIEEGRTPGRKAPRSGRGLRRCAQGAWSSETVSRLSSI